MSTFALVIGVDSYRTLDPSGHDDLWGAENDARAWYRWLTTRLGVPASSVRLLCTTPGADVSGAPTFAGIQEGLAHLAAQLRAAKAAGEPASAVVTFSGHGVAFGDTGTAGAGLGNTMGICPCDVTRDPSGEVVGAWRVGDLMATFGPDLVDDVTVVLDACYTTDPEGVRPHRSLSAPGVTPSGPPVPGRVLLACEPWAQAFEFTAGGERRGAFSVAMLTLLEQWSLRRDRGTYPNVNHGDLVYRARQLLGVLGVAQTPMLLGVARVELVPFLRPGLDIAMGTTSPEPDAHRHGAQLSSGAGQEGGDYRIYEFWVGGNRMATVVVPAVSYTATSGPKQGFTWAAGMEYWYINTVSTAAPTGDIKVVVVRGLNAGTWVWPANGGSPSFHSVGDDPCAVGVANVPTTSWTSAGSGVSLPANCTGWKWRGGNQPRAIAIEYLPSGSTAILSKVHWLNNNQTTQAFFGAALKPTDGNKSMHFTNNPPSPLPAGTFYYHQPL